ncbi:hypothetical protein BGW38_002936, partial [Lunasporangiospora selenospora]
LSQYPIHLVLRSLLRNMTTDVLTLFCLVDRDTTVNGFSVDISSNKTVDDLKKLIKAEQAPRFDDVALTS